MKAVENAEAARALRELSTAFAEQGDSFRAHGLESAARSVERLQRPVAELWRVGGLPALIALPWVSKSVALCLVELLNFGRIADLELLHRARFLMRTRS